MPRRMMPFTLYKRKIQVSSGKVVAIYYYRVRGTDGVIHAYSTGEENKTNAMKQVLELFKEGKLLRIEKPTAPTIREYSRDFWRFDGARVQSALLRKRLTPAYCDANQGTVERHWWPTLGEKPINELTVRDIERLIMHKRKGDPKSGSKPLSSKMVNQILQAMKGVYAEAVRVGDLASSPFDRVQAVQVKKIARSILTPDEAFELLGHPEWFQDRSLWVLNLTAATTGARAGELLGLRVCCVHRDRIEIRGVKRAKAGFVEDTKTGERGFRGIPIPTRTADALADLCNGREPEDFVFGDLAPHMTSQSLSDALSVGGIMTKTERIAKNIDFHSWRHWYGSMLRGRVSDIALRKTTGHLTEAMTENYSHRLEEHLVDVAKAQDEAFARLQES